MFFSVTWLSVIDLFLANTCVGCNDDICGEESHFQNIETACQMYYSETTLEKYPLEKV